MFKILQTNLFAGFKSKIKEVEEHDVRDYQAGDVLQIPVDFDFPKKMYLGDLLPATYYQGAVPACTAMGKTHVSRIQNIIDHKSNKIELSFKDLWAKMGHKWLTTAQGEKGDYLEKALKVEHKEGIEGTDKKGNKHIFKIDGYAYNKIPEKKEDFEKAIKYFIATNKPIYTFWKGNSTIRNQMSAGRISKLVALKDANGGHALAITGYDEKDAVYTNSRKPNKGALSEFKISRDLLREAYKAGLIGRRFRITFDNEDRPAEKLFEDFSPSEETEEYQAVKRAKENGVIKGVEKEDGKVYLEPNRPMTRKEVLLVLYRLENKK